jgi:preprotein translocase subunit SecD
LALGQTLGLLALLAACAAAPPQHTLAHDGGLRLTLHAACLAENPHCDVIQAREAALPIVSHRLSDGLGLANATVQPDGADGIVVELPGTQDDSQILPLLLARGRLTILDTQGEQLSVGSSVTGLTCTSACQAGQYPVVFTGAQINPIAVSAQNEPRTNMPVVYFGFSGAARDQFAAYTRDHIGQFFTAALDDTVIESAVIASEIDGEGELSGFRTLDEARRLAVYLKFGPLPAALSVAGEEQVTPAAG